MKITVDFYDENDDDIGTLVFDGKSFSWANVEKDWIKNIIEDPINVMDEKIEAKKSPTKYMMNLFKAYRGAYLRASKPIIHK